MVKVLSILVLLFVADNSFGQFIPSDTMPPRVDYSVQVLSTSMYPYPFEDSLYKIVYADSIYIESVEVKGKSYHRYLIRCADLIESHIMLDLVREKYPDSFIVYYTDGKRFN